MMSSEQRARSETLITVAFRDVYIQDVERAGDRNSTTRLLAGSHSDAGSSMVASAVKPHGNNDLSATHPVIPSPTNPTRTSEPLPAVTPDHTPVPDPHPAAPTHPRDPNRYQIMAEHGRGGLGRVCRAHDRELGRDVAIKELLSRGHVSEVRFLREALITARLEHPGIVPVHEAGRWPDGTPFYAMKLVSGRPLRELIAERTTVEQRIGLLHHVIAVADAIAYAHDRNIIHRDLKPANVIVGDFGETIVIDWGLAKDLTATEESTVGGGPFRTTRDDDLTSAGSVLGTPAYMAPEQERGEHVDQRADVFALGAMLWELCALQKLPPREPQLRHRILRRAGIDKDLVTIIDKALDADPRRRYPDAGALAADLKAFKSGARIAARSYSLLAMLAHWTRRHRTLALAVTAVIALAVAGSVLYVENIAAARDRADAALQRAEATANDLTLEHAELTLKHAQLLLTADPSAALDSLATYHGADHDRVKQLRAEAMGLGVALLRAVPHSDSTRWAEGNADGTIVSLSTDGTITRTAPDQTSVVLARGVSPRGRFAYAPARDLLAYACDPADLCLWDIRHGARIPLSQEFHGWQLAGIAFSPGGTQLALISNTGVLRVFDVTAPAQPAERLHLDTGDGVAVLFVDEDVIAVGTMDGVKLVRMNGQTQTLLVPDGSLWDASAADHRMVLATTRGEGLLVEFSPVRVTNRANLCHDAVSGLKFLPGQRTVAYSCKEGTVGTWDLQTGMISPLAHLEGHADMVAVSKAGDYLVAAGGNGTLTVIDLYTNLVTSYKGHRSRLTSISPPTREFPFFLSADVRGALRVWPLPNRFAQVVANVHTRVISAFFTKKDPTIVATTYRPEITVFSPSSDVRAIGPHLGNTTFTQLAGNGDTFATYGSGESIEIWSSLTMTRQQIVDTHHGAVSHVEFIDNTNDFVTAGRDGRFIQWTSAGDQKLLARFEQPIASFVLARATRSAVISTADGALWRSGDDGQMLQVRSAGTRVTRMLTVPESAEVCIGYANGDVIVIDTKSWQQTLLLHASEAIRDIAFTSDGRTIAVAANDDTIHVGGRYGIAWTDANATWVRLTLRARAIALTPDGLLVAICTDGTVWLYSITRRTWVCVPTGTSDLNLIAISGDGKLGAAFDADGRIIRLDLESVRSVNNNAFKIYRKGEQDHEEIHQ
jgi:WD40 repeat protein